jgi:ABC-type uncharacterized transport system ATPase subunit
MPALSIADHGYVMENGRIMLDDSIEKIKEYADVKEFYLGLTEVGKTKSYRDVKHYKRRKRWLTLRSRLGGLVAGNLEVGKIYFQRKTLIEIVLKDLIL